MEKNVTILNYYKLCRACLNEKINMRPIFEAHVPNMFMTCTAVVIEENDGLPQQICTQCLQQISRNYTFKQLCEKSDTVLREFLIKNSNLKENSNISNGFNIQISTESRMEILNVVTDCINIEDNIKQDNIEILNSTNMYTAEGIDLEGNETVRQDLISLQILNENLELNETCTTISTDLDKNKQFECITCNKLFTAKWKLTAHIRGHTGQGSYICEVCGKRCSMPSLLKKHMKIHAANRHEQMLERRRMANKPHRCKICHRGFLCADSMRKHVREQHYGEKRRYEKKHMCTACGKKFCNRSWLEIHMRKHTGERPLTCDVCGKTFAMPSSLNKHSLIHLEPRHKCTQCDKAFTQQFQLTVHMRKHTGERPFICGICGKGASTNDSAKIHMRTHTGEKPFRCSQCNSAFASRSQLTIHIRRHAGEKPYTCTICNRAFLQKGDLDTHVRYHTGERPYACKFCPKRYFAHSALRVHTMSHTGVKPHECTVCKKRFVSSHVLKTHMRTHTGEKPYSCTVCGHKFSQSGALSTHMKAHAKN